MVQVVLTALYKNAIGKHYHNSSVGAISTNRRAARPTELEGLGVTWPAHLSRTCQWRHDCRPVHVLLIAAATKCKKKRQLIPTVVTHVEWVCPWSSSTHWHAVSLSVLVAALRRSAFFPASTTESSTSITDNRSRWAPEYITDLCIPCQGSRLRSATRGNFQVRGTNLKLTTGPFSVSGPRHYNTLSTWLRQAGSLATFCNKLKTHFLNLSHNV